MNIVVWADKGGTGKTTVSTNLAAALGVELLDLDPQGDASRWATARGEAARVLQAPSAPPLTTKDLCRALGAALEEEGVRVVDCPPGQGDLPLTAVAMADLLIIPARTGDAKMVALGRSLDVARRVRENRPDLKIGVVLNLARETGRAKGIETALKTQAGVDYLWLGRLSARVGVEEAYADGKTLLQAGGAAAHEFRCIWGAVEAALPSGSY
jgi:chromosome partitioning protein